MKDLNDYFGSIANKSKFSCKLGAKGGFINFQNSGQRGSVKEFTLSLETILAGLKDIERNMDVFSGLTRYEEKAWRDTGASSFNDLILNSMITVQTKPCFTTFSKIINWANNKPINDYDDNSIDLSKESIKITIDRLEELSSAFTPTANKITKTENIENEVIDATDMLSISKPFLLLAGNSGTGKTRFVRKQAGVNKNLTETYCLTSVRPDWHEPSDLLGYISRLNGDAEYVTTDVLQFIAKAWRGIMSSELAADEVEIPDQGKRLAISGEREALRNVLPYWLCLDEMNLAPVEQYFSDYLSVLETREWRWDENRFKYLSDPLLKAATIDQVKDKAALRKGLGFEDVQFDEIWEHFCKHGLGIPFNLIVAGTVNMDETTHGFSRKVIDRALSFDFGAFFPNDFDQFFYPRTVNKTLSYPVLSQADPKCLSDTHDRDGSKSIAFLKVVNGILDNTPFQLAYRALNELLLAVASHKPKDELSLKAVWDDFLMCKVLPRIEGDADKLRSAPSVLELLTIELEKQFAEFWDKQDDEPNARPDLFREATEGEDRVVRVACRSKAKLEWMQVRLVNSSFTSFWP